MGVGDPAADVMVAWKLHSAASRDAFREALPTDDATWARARGRVVRQAVAALAYYTPKNNPLLYREAENWLELVLSERRPNELAGHAECGHPGARTAPMDLET
jgi:aminoglycoside phosphotransferase (APT) family kinase protein